MAGVVVVSAVSMITACGKSVPWKDDRGWDFAEHLAYIYGIASPALGYLAIPQAVQTSS